MHLQRLLREPPADLVGGIVDTDLPTLTPETPLAAVTRYFAAYNLVCGPVVDDQNHLLGAVTVDDLLDHLLPHDWRVDARNRTPRRRRDAAGGAAVSKASVASGWTPRGHRAGSRCVWTPRPSARSPSRSPGSSAPAATC